MQVNWSLASATMEQRAIKTDVIASEDAYFMATHVPFANLEILRGGSQLVEGGSLRLSEEEVYQQLIYNPDNIHRMIIVRGSNGTGKSHLIRWLRARYENDKERFDSSQEKIIFLRRLSNTIRGAIKQILDEDIVFDADMRAKLEKFVSSSHSMDAENFKLSIYHHYIVELSSDTDNKTYSKCVRRDIAAFLADPRVEQHMLRIGGPIDRCFNAITAPSDQVFKGESTFSEEDFSLPRDMKRAIKNSGSDEAENILGEISDADYVSKLVKYLNSFTSKVIQNCADISSEGTKEVFLQLRRELKKQGKNLTIFIEDFTAFTGLDTELITVLAAEHGGENSDLCRVTSIIGITDQYYKQFRGNFTDRVQYQVFVNAGSYGSPEFLIEMTARYLNAIYCDPKKIEEWFAQGALEKELPCSGFAPEYPWDTTTIAGNELTLYPFNKKSVLALYEALSEDGNSSRGYEKTPRMFLLYVIKEQMSRFMDGQVFGQWNYPSEACIACPILLSDAAHDSAIDGIAYLSEKDRRRVKVLLQFWGNGTASVAADTIGAIRNDYFADIALGKFTGFGGDNVTEQGDQTNTVSDEKVEKVVDEAEKKRKKNLQDRISDINEWITSGTTLNYSADYRKWMREFLQESINWQADGIPAYIASKRLSDHSAVYIECQKETTTKEKAIVVLERTKETKDLLTAIVYRYYAKSWGFTSGVYFQLRTISWLEKNRNQIVEAVTQGINYSLQNDVLKWCVAVEYLQAAFLGISIPHGDTLAIAQKLLANKSCAVNKAPRASGNQNWDGAIRYLNSQEATYADCHEIFQESLRTFMGTDVSDKQRAIGFFRTRELLDIVTSYEKQGWHLAVYDTEKKEAGVYRVASYMNNLLSKIHAATSQEDSIGISVIERLKKHLGEITEGNIAKLITSVSMLFHAFDDYNRPVSESLLSAFKTDAKATAKKVVEACKSLQNAIDEKEPVAKLALYAEDPIAYLQQFVRNLDSIEGLATSVTTSAQKEMEPLSNGKDISIIKARGIEVLKHAFDEIHRLEVMINAD